VVRGRGNAGQRGMTANKPTSEKGLSGVMTQRGQQERAIFHGGEMKRGFNGNVNRHKKMGRRRKG